MLLTKYSVRGTRFGRCGKTTLKGRLKLSIVYQVDRVLEVEGKIKLTHTDGLAAERLQQQLTNLDEEFKTYLMGMVDL